MDSPGTGERRVALFTTLYAGGLAGALALLALFMGGLDAVLLAARQSPYAGEGADAALLAFQFFNVLTLFGGAAGTFYAAHYDFTWGAQTTQKSMVAGLNLLAIPLILVLQAQDTAVAVWVGFLGGAALSSVNLLALVFCQYKLTAETVVPGVKYGGAFALFVLLGAGLEAYAFVTGTAAGHLWPRFSGHVLILGASAAAAFYALHVAREVWEQAVAEFADPEEVAA